MSLKERGKSFGWGVAFTVLTGVSAKLTQWSGEAMVEVGKESMKGGIGDQMGWQPALAFLFVATTALAITTLGTTGKALYNYSASAFGKERVNKIPFCNFFAKAESPQSAAPVPENRQPILAPTSPRV